MGHFLAVFALILAHPVSGLGGVFLIATFNLPPAVLPPVRGQADILRRTGFKVVDVCVV